MSKYKVESRYREVGEMLLVVAKRKKISALDEAVFDYLLRHDIVVQNIIGLIKDLPDPNEDPVETVNLFNDKNLTRVLCPLHEVAPDLVYRDMVNHGRRGGRCYLWRQGGLAPALFNHLNQ